MRTIDAVRASLRQNRRFQAGLVLIVALVCIEGGLRWNERLDVKLGELQQARSELRSLRRQSRDEASLSKSLADLRQVRQGIDSRLWVVSSEAVGQARLNDWMKSVLKRTGIASQSMKISAVQALNRNDPAGMNPPGTSAGNNTRLPNEGGHPGLRQIRITLSFAFTPANLEQILGEIEGGEAYAEVEAMTVFLRERRVELIIRTLMRVDHSAAILPAPVGSALTASKNNS